MFSWCSSGIIPEILTIYFNIKNKIKDSHIWKSKGIYHIIYCAPFYT